MNRIVNLPIFPMSVKLLPLLLFVFVTDRLPAQTMWCIGTEPRGSDNFVPYCLFNREWIREPGENPGGGKLIAVGPGNRPYIVNSANDIYEGRDISIQGNAVKVNWVGPLHGPTKALAIAASSEHVWIIQPDGLEHRPYWLNTRGSDPAKYIFQPDTNELDKVTGKRLAGEEIAVGPGHQPWLVTADGRIFQRRRDVEPKWENVDPERRASCIAANAGGVWILLKRNPGEENSAAWQLQGDKFASTGNGKGNWIALDAEGSPWIVNSSEAIYKRVEVAPGTFDWIQQTGAAKRIASAPTVVRRTGNTPPPSPAPSGEPRSYHITVTFSGTAKVGGQRLEKTFVKYDVPSSKIPRPSGVLGAITDLAVEAANTIFAEKLDQYFDVGKGVLMLKPRLEPNF